MVSKKKNWNLNVLHKPSSIHVCLTPLWDSGVVDTFLQDITEAAEALNKNKNAFDGDIAPMYGMAAKIPDRSIISDLLASILDAVLDT